MHEVDAVPGEGEEGMEGDGAFPGEGEGEMPGAGGSQPGDGDGRGQGSGEGEGEGIPSNMTEPVYDPISGEVPYGKVFSAYYSDYLRGSENGEIPYEIEDAARAYFEDLAQSGADSAAVREVMEYVISAPQKTDAPRAAYWMLIAVQGLTRPLLPLLSASDAGTVCALLEKIFPR